jgi:hypothetical protein
MIYHLIYVAAALVMMVLPVQAAESPQSATSFVHSDHLLVEEAAECTNCHLPEATSIEPERKVCQACHDQPFVDQVVFPGLKTHGLTWALEHRQAAKAKAIDCEACHEQKFCMECHKEGPADAMGKFSNNMVNVHRSDFHITHPIAARSNPQRCASCHETKYCQDCHDNFAPADLAIQSHRRGWSDLKGGVNHGYVTENLGTVSCQLCHPDSVLPQHEWSSRHAREARKNLMTCQACHPEGDVCMKCHSALSGLMINPHPSNWDSNKDRIKKASNGRTCRKCH